MRSSPGHGLVGLERLTLDAAHLQLLQAGEVEPHRMTGMDCGSLHVQLRRLLCRPAGC